MGRHTAALAISPWICSHPAWHQAAYSMNLEWILAVSVLIGTLTLSSAAAFAATWWTAPWRWSRSPRPA